MTKLYPKTGDNKVLLQRIANNLLIKNDLLNLPGLFYGRFGIIMFFFLYSRYSKQDTFNKVAENLIEELLTKLHHHLPVGFANGYCGIAWGITYLVRHQFIAGDLQDILEEIDKKIMETDIRRITDMSLSTGFEGVIHYVLTRTAFNTPSTSSPFDSTYLSDCYNKIKEIEEQEPQIQIIVNQYTKISKQTENINKPELFFLDGIDFSNTINKELWKWDLGIYKGCAGMGLQLMKRG